MNSSVIAIYSKLVFIDVMLANTGHYFPKEKNAVLLQYPPVIKILHYVEVSSP